jgi:hypothetical protein
LIRSAASCSTDSKQLVDDDPFQARSEIPYCFRIWFLDRDEKETYSSMPFLELRKALAKVGRVIQKL